MGYIIPIRNDGDLALELRSESVKIIASDGEVCEMTYEDLELLFDWLDTPDHWRQVFGTERT